MAKPFTAQGRKSRLGGMNWKFLRKKAKRWKNCSNTNFVHATFHCISYKVDYFRWNFFSILFLSFRLLTIPPSFQCFNPKILVSFAANTALYAHYVFNTLDSDRSGIVSFEVSWWDEREPGECEQPTQRIWIYRTGFVLGRGRGEAPRGIVQNTLSHRKSCKI